MSGVPPSYIRCALCLFWKKKAQQNKNLDYVLFAFFRKQHELKRNHFDIECLLLADWSYKRKIRILWIVFRCLQWSYYQMCIVCVLIELQFINKFLQAINQSQKNISKCYMVVFNVCWHTLYMYQNMKRVWLHNGYHCPVQWWRSTTTELYYK